MKEKTRRCARCGETKPLSEYYSTPTYCKKCVLEYQKEHYESGKHPYKKENNDYQKEYNQKRRKRDPEFKIIMNMRNLLGAYIKRKTGKLMDRKLEDVLGCSQEEFIEHIESQFEPWMNWENYGGRYKKGQEKETHWEVDHIIGMPSAETDEDVYKLNHHTNLRPRDQVDNRSDSKKRGTRNKVVKGYYFNKKTKRYIAQIRIDGKGIYLGCFKNEEDAKECYRQALNKYENK